MPCNKSIMTQAQVHISRVPNLGTMGGMHFLVEKGVGKSFFPHGQSLKPMLPILFFTKDIYHPFQFTLDNSELCLSKILCPSKQYLKSHFIHCTRVVIRIIMHFFKTFKRHKVCPQTHPVCTLTSNCSTPVLHYTIVHHMYHRLFNKSPTLRPS